MFQDFQILIVCDWWNLYETKGTHFMMWMEKTEKKKQESIHFISVVYSSISFMWNEECYDSVLTLGTEGVTNEQVYICFNIKSICQTKLDFRVMLANLIKWHYFLYL